MLLAAICCMSMVFPCTTMADALISGDYNYQDADFWVVVDAPDNYVNFRYGPGTEYSIIMPIYNGEYLHVTRTANNRFDGLYWGQIEYDGQYGWISISQTSYTDNPYAYSSDNNYSGDNSDNQNYSSDNSGTDSQNNSDKNKIADTNVDIDTEQLYPDAPWQNQYYEIIEVIIPALKESHLTEAATAETTDKNTAATSSYKAAAALAAKDGDVYTGSLVEISDPSLNICPETSALVKAVESGETSFQMITVVSEAQNSTDTDYYVPCADCLKRLADFCDAEEFYVLSIKLDSDNLVTGYKMFRLSDLME